MSASGTSLTPTAPFWADWRPRSQTFFAKEQAGLHATPRRLVTSSVVINAEKVVVTGKKETDKLFMSYSGWKGGEKYTSVAQIRARHPERLILHAVKGMIPKKPAGRPFADQASKFTKAATIRTARKSRRTLAAAN